MQNKKPSWREYGYFLELHSAWEQRRHSRESFASHHCGLDLNPAVDTIR